MKKVLKILAWLFAIFIIFVTIGLSYIKLALPNVGDAPDMVIEPTDERLERGKYLAHHVMMCIDCHSQRDFSTFSAPVIEGTKGMGGMVFDQEFGLPGAYVSANITPAGIGDWTDGELFRAITTGVNRDGKPLFPIMPYHNYRLLDEEDIKSVIAYIRTLEPIENETGRSKSDFPMSIIIHTMPQKAALEPMPSKTDLIKYGQYITTAAVCADCHNNMEKGNLVGLPYGGGAEFRFPDGAIIRSANITPHPTAGIGAWSREQFVSTFKQYADSAHVLHNVGPGEFQTIMPWTDYAGMSEEDLGAIYEYLRTIAPSDNVVERFTPPPIN